jgi:hypothetical protein
MVRIFLLTDTELSGNELSDFIENSVQETEEEDIPVAAVIEMVEEDIAVAPVSEMVPVAAVIEIDLMDRLHNNICNVSIPNTTKKRPYLCYLISTFSLIFSIESYHNVIWNYETRNYLEVAMVNHLKFLSNMSKNYSLDNEPLKILQSIRKLLELRSPDNMFKIYKKYVRMLSI